MVLSSKSPNRAFVVSKNMKKNSCLASLFVILFTISPLSSVQASRSEEIVPSTAPVRVLRNEIDEPIIMEITSPTIRTYSISVTAYTSTIEECDSDPFITADGSTVRDGIIAANFLPFGTKVRFPSLFGNRIFEVRDRMNPRYHLRADIWMTQKKDARQFGLHRNVVVEVIEWGDNRNTTWAKRALEIAAKKSAALKQVDL